MLPPGESRGESVTIVGAGLVGALLATILSKRGYSVTVYEAQLDMRRAGAVAPKSINLVLTARGLRAVAYLGQDILDEMLKLSTRVTGRVIHPQEGEPFFQRYGKVRLAPTVYV